MNKRKGFTLVELLVYVILFGFAAYVMISSNTVLAQWCSWAVERQHGQLQQMLLGDIIMRDVLAATHDPQYWSREHGVFRKQFLDQHNRPVAYDVGYECSATECMRVHGLFNYKTNTWQRRQRSVLAQLGAEKITLKPLLGVANNKTVVQRVEITLVYAFSRPSDFAHSELAFCISTGSGRADHKTYRVRSQVVPHAR